MGIPKIAAAALSPESGLTTVCELGAGGMGTVALSRLRSAGGFDRLVVVKRLHPHLTEDAVVRDRFLGEARIAARIHHANVVGIQQVGHDAAGYYLVLDYVDGGSLHELLRAAAKSGRRLSTTVIGRILLDALAGLEAVHSARDVEGRALGILHRDVSPQNLLVGRDGITRITDFGVSKAAADRPMTAPGTFVGKLRYLAPECLLMDRTTTAIDVYAMAVTAWCALAGHPPWLGMGDGRMALEICKNGLPPLPEGDGNEQLRDVLAKAASKDPAARFASAREMALAMSEALRSCDGIASPSEVSETIESILSESIEKRRESLASMPEIEDDANREVVDESGMREKPTVRPPAFRHRDSRPELPPADRKHETRSFPLIVPRRSRARLAVGAVAASVLVGALALGVSLRASSGPQTEAAIEANVLQEMTFVTAAPAMPIRGNVGERFDAKPLPARLGTPRARTFTDVDISTANPYR